MSERELTRERLEYVCEHGVKGGHYATRCGAVHHILATDAALRTERDNLRMRIKAVDAEHADIERQKHQSIKAFLTIEAERDALKVQLDASRQGLQITTHEYNQHLVDLTRKLVEAKAQCQEVWREVERWCDALGAGDAKSDYGIGYRTAMKEISVHCEQRALISLG